MKRIFSVLTLISSFWLYSQESIAFEDTSFQEVLAKAKKENKLVFMDAYAAWCGPCKLMEKNVFPQANVKDFYNKTFINSRFDMEKGEGREIAKKYGVYSYPTYLFFNGDGDLVFKSMGYQEAEQFINLGKRVVDPAGADMDLKAKFEKGNADPDFLFDLIAQYYQTDPTFAKKVSERYFATKKDSNFSKEELMMLVYFLKSTDDTSYKVFANNKEQVLKVISADEYQKLDVSFKLNKVLASSINEAKAEVDEAKFYKEAIKVVTQEEAHDFLSRFKLQYLPSVQRFDDYAKVAVEVYKDGSNVDPNELLQAAFIFSDKIKDKALLKNAVQWAEKSIMKSETAESTYVLAKLYFLIGKKAEAKMYAEQSVNLFKQKNGDASYPEQLLKDIN